MKLSVLIIFTITLPLSAWADIETDRVVGNCAGLLSALKKPEKAKEAIGYADNQNRAIKFGTAWINKASSYGNNKTMVDSMVYSATSDCHSIGIRTSD